MNMIQTAREAHAVASSAPVETEMTAHSNMHPVMSLDEWRATVDEQVECELASLSVVIAAESAEGQTRCSSIRWEEIHWPAYDAQDAAFVIATADLVTDGLCTALKALGYSTHCLSQKVRDVVTPSYEEPDMYKSEVVIDWSNPTKALETQE